MKYLLPIILTLFSGCAQADFCATHCSAPHQPTRYGALVYLGKITENTLGQVVGMNFSLDQETLYSIELTRTFSSDSAVRRYFGPLFHRAWLNLNITYHDDPVKGAIYEFAPYFSAHWRLINWQRHLNVYLAIGEGVSYVSNVPLREFRNSDEPKKLLNYLMFEFCFVHPCYSQLELVARIHHRSGVFGLYNANNSGSTAVGLAIRYFFF